MARKDGEWANALAGILRVGLSNVLKVLSGVLVGFILPRLLTVTDYGFCRTCTLYASYVGLFSTGIIDGIALRYAGMALSGGDERALRHAGRAFLLLEGLIAAAAAVTGLLMGPGEQRFILLYLSVFLLTNNITSYCQTLSQVTGRFRQLSRFTGLQSLLGALAVAGLWLMGRMGTAADARAYLLLYTAGNLTVMLLYLYRWRELLLGPSLRRGEDPRVLPGLIRTGTPLMLANLCTLLLLNVDRQFVTVFFSRDTYGIYAFACNVMTMITMVISAVSTVLYPAMKRMSREKLLSSWPVLNEGILLLVFGCMASFFPLTPFIRWYLPAYADSLLTLRILFPGLAAASATTIIVHNYDKTLGLSNRFCLQSMMVLALSAAADGLMVSLTRSVYAISAASVVMLFVWYAVTGLTLHRRFSLPMGRLLLCLATGTGLFWLCTADFMPLWLGALVYMTAAALTALRWVKKAAPTLRGL